MELNWGIWSSCSLEKTLTAHSTAPFSVEGQTSAYRSCCAGSSRSSSTAVSSFALGVQLPEGSTHSALLPYTLVRFHRGCPTGEVCSFSLVWFWSLLAPRWRNLSNSGSSRKSSGPQIQATFLNISVISNKVVVFISICQTFFLFLNWSGGRRMLHFETRKPQQSLRARQVFPLVVEMEARVKC